MYGPAYLLHAGRGDQDRGVRFARLVSRGAGDLDEVVSQHPRGFTGLLLY